MSEPSLSASNSCPPAKPSQETEDFLRLYSLYQKQIYASIGTYFRNSADIDEVLQETSIILWSKFHELRSDGDFLRWAIGIARFEVLRHLRKHKNGSFPFDEEVAELLAEERDRHLDYLDLRREALERCLKKLKLRDRTLIEDCYSSNTLVKQVAKRMCRPVNAVYQSLSRIRRSLHDCITRSLAAREN